MFSEFSPESKMTRHLTGRSGSYGDNGDNEDFDMKPPFRFPFVVNGPKYLVLHSVFWAAQKEIAEFASQLLLPGDIVNRLTMLENTKNLKKIPSCWKTIELDPIRPKI